MHRPRHPARDQPHLPRAVAAARLLQVHCFPLLRSLHQDDLPAHGLHLPEVRHPRAGRRLPHRASLCAEQHPHRLPRSARRGADPKDSRLPHGYLRELCRRRLGLYHDHPATAVSAPCRRQSRARYRQFLAGGLLADLTRRLPQPALFCQATPILLQLGQSLPEGIPFADNPGAAQPADRERLSRREPVPSPDDRPGFRCGTKRRSLLPEATAERLEPGQLPGLAVSLGRVLLKGQVCPREVRSGCRGPSSSGSGPRAEPCSSRRSYVWQEAAGALGRGGALGSDTAGRRIRPCECQ